MRQRQRVPVLSILGFTVVLGMAVVVLMGYIQLTVLSSDTVALKEELKTLKTENVMLTAQYERMFDLANVREAAEAAGMSKPSASQICYLDISNGDSVEIYQKEDAGLLEQLKETLSRSVYAVVEYFQ